MNFRQDRPHPLVLRPWRKPLAATAAALGAIAAVALAPIDAAPAADTGPQQQVVNVDGHSSGRTFEGIGVESAGAATRLLKDYPKAQRTQILDYLFKPNYGANLQQLKVEIGGDMNSTDGAEPSHMRTPDEIDCSRGYEWWLMEQATRRNPNIALSGVQWGAPAWVGAGANTVWTKENIRYDLAWLDCAKQHGLRISYLGGWTERGFDADWLKSLRRALDSHGYSHVKILSDDSFGWDLANAMAEDPELKDVVDVVGVHYPCGFPYGTNCPSTPTATALGKPLWASEQTNAGYGDFNFYNAGAAGIAGEFNRVYIDGQMTATFVWNALWSAYKGLPFPAGLILANTPWSGNYTVGKSLWAVAHTTQFAKPGWKYIDAGSARLSGGGSVVTLREPHGSDWSSVVETTDATSAQKLSFHVAGGLSTGKVSVWATNLKSTTASDSFQRVAQLRPHNGTIDLEVQPGYAYTVTTTHGQGHGTASPIVPEPSNMKLPYKEGFETHNSGTTPRYFSDLAGAFEAEHCGSGKGNCLTQQIVDRPVEWAGFNSYPSTLVGDPDWTNYTIGVDARVPASGSTELVGRALAPQVPVVPGFTDGIQGYHLRIDGKGNWTLFREDGSGLGANSHRVDIPLATGTKASLQPGTWHRLALTLDGGNITAFVDNTKVATVQDSKYSTGQTGLALSDWVRGQFDNLTVEPIHN